MSDTVEEYDMEMDLTDCCCGNYMPEIGDYIIDMDLNTYHKGAINMINTSDYRGKWLVLFFYPEDFTFVCPTEIEDMADHYAQLQEMNVEVLSVSTDSASAHKVWHEQSEAVGKAEFPMAADPTGIFTRSMGVYIEDEGFARRATFIINPEGALRAYEVNDGGIGRNAAETVRKVQAAQFVAEHGDKVCPAKWAPGSDTLTPGADLVNKI